MLRLIYPELSYRDTTVEADIVMLYNRHESLGVHLFNHIMESGNQHKLLDLLHVHIGMSYYNIRSHWIFSLPKTRTDRIFSCNLVQKKRCGLLEPK